MGHDDSAAATTRRVHVVAAVIHDGSRLLACRRRRDLSAGGRWEFPGGKVEPGEDAVEALRREIGEELGVDISVGSPLVRSGTVVAATLIDLECRWARLNGPAPTRSSDHDRLRWVDRDELSGFDWCTPDLDAVALLRDGALAPD
ncbi:8-oxo-dGTP diphosphatase [Stackebrandtia endophytica]|uniref:8-oxo-dGTP diphosphatase n=1 Tax=Stackebrandtia endophytica TaxID=1496996 RepID=A0A543B4A2_9ACTN|nr:(deoxy)nucleoside triphosphate pyrophosphohydrolase [Stackebrandtia endophytica]TQL79652.1 8-oxo-dGTP diphosphatase [Stackebrandtia endophytica]